MFKIPQISYYYPPLQMGSEMNYPPVLKMELNEGDVFSTKYLTYKIGITNLSPLVGYTVNATAILNEMKLVEKKDNFTLIKRPLPYKTDFLNRVHFIWTAVNPDEDKFEHLLPYTIVAAYQIESTVGNQCHLMTMNCKGIVQEYEFKLKSKKFDKKKVQDEISSISDFMGNCFFFLH